MKQAFIPIDGDIIGFNKDKGEITIKVPKETISSLMNTDYRHCKLQLSNGKALSAKQRKFCYALLHDIANWSGMHMEETKHIMKEKFLEDYVDGLDIQDFSLKDAPMTLVRDFQDFLIDFVLSFGISTKMDLKEEVSMKRYVYRCVQNRKCCVCGQDGSVYVNSDGFMVPVCGAHRIELLTEGSAFYQKYHIEPIFYDEEM